MDCTIVIVAVIGIWGIVVTDAKERRMQVEVKDIYGAKVIDEFVKVENEWGHYFFIK